MQGIVEATLVILAIVGVIALLAWAIHQDCKDRAQRDATADVLLDGHAVSEETLVDRAQGKSWRIIRSNRAVIIIPGSERNLRAEQAPVPAEKK